ncbi:helix-turn-helix transcriptional regulator [Octadecabacter sp. SW4]|uniref:helix-turn-helix domain-containing protein n=1 Tax=Octadecabacter sp. SW4 TaxID=2602067 RepID=UPI0020C8112F|nr:helix-turn-helix transcriptional regulator [Octadecabacter sp. SW4]
MDDVMENTDDAGWFSEETATFGDRVAGARESTGLTQKALAKKLGIKLSTLRNWEEDLNEPRANKLQMLSGVLGVSMSWLLTGNGTGPDAPMDAGEAQADIAGILAEMRGLRTQMIQSAERLGQLEKRLRTALREPA